MVTKLKNAFVKMFPTEPKKTFRVHVQKNHSSASTAARFIADANVHDVVGWMRNVLQEHIGVPSEIRAPRAPFEWFPSTSMTVRVFNPKSTITEYEEDEQSDDGTCTQLLSIMVNGFGDDAGVEIAHDLDVDGKPTHTPVKIDTGVLVTGPLSELATLVRPADDGLMFMLQTHLKCERTAVAATPKRMQLRSKHSRPRNMTIIPLSVREGVSFLVGWGIPLRCALVWFGLVAVN